MEGAASGEWRQLPGGDLLAGTQATVLGHQGSVLSPCQDDSVGTWLDGAVAVPLVLEAEALPALSALPGEQLTGGEGLPAPRHEQALAGDCRGVVPPEVASPPPVLPAGGCELITGVSLTGHKGAPPAVQGEAGHCLV